MNKRKGKTPLLPFDGTIQDKFEEYHRARPEIMVHLLRLVAEVRGRGFKHYGMKSFWERMRWHFQIEQGDAEFKLNNSYTSRYARKLVEENPELEGFFEMRELQS